MASEPFPSVSSTTAKISTPPNGSLGTRRPRQSSSLGADPRGDTGASAISTANIQPGPPSPGSPVSAKGSRESGRKRRKARHLLARWKRVALKHTWLTPLIISLTVLLLYALSPGRHNPLHAAIFLSYPDPPALERTNTLPAHVGNVTQYGQGWRDLAFVAYYTIVLSFTREFLMQRLIRPLAVRWGIRGRGKISRFMEQFYTAIYFSVAGPVGLYVMSRTPVWYFNTAGMFEGYPHRAHEACFKAYYLLQASYWAQQGLVLLLQLEKPRKDFRELVLHHIVTLALIALSYRFHFTYMGVAVYITHDISDFFLATSKVFNYLDHPITVPYFGFFIAVWAYFRHFINLRILYALFPYNLGFGTANEFATVGPYIKDMASHQYKCWISQIITFALLAALQAVNIFWFWLICRILARILFSNVVQDERSDDEEEEEEEVHEKKMNGNGAATKPRVMVNGEPIKHEHEQKHEHVSAEGTAVDGGRKATLRKRDR